MRLEQLAHLFELRDAVAQFFANAQNRAFGFVLRGHELLRRINHRGRKGFQIFAGQRIKARDSFDLFSEKLDAQSFLGVGWSNLDRVAAHPKFAAFERNVVSRIEQAHEAAQQLFPRHLHPNVDPDDERFIVLPAANSVDARDAGDHDDIAAGEKRAHGREAHSLNLFVHARILLDERVGARDVGLRLIIIEVADEIFDGVFRKKPLEFRVKLGSQSFVMRDDQRRPLDIFDYIRDGKRFSRAGHAEKRLMFCSRQKALGQL